MLAVNMSGIALCKDDEPRDGNAFMNAPIENLFDKSDVRAVLQDGGTHGVHDFSACQNLRPFFARIVAVNFARTVLCFDNKYAALADEDMVDLTGRFAARIVEDDAVHQMIVFSQKTSFQNARNKLFARLAFVFSFRFTAPWTRGGGGRFVLGKDGDQQDDKEDCRADNDINIRGHE